jgi:hypothetical protein
MLYLRYQRNLMTVTDFRLIGFRTSQLLFVIYSGITCPLCVYFMHLAQETPKCDWNLFSLIIFRVTSVYLIVAVIFRSFRLCWVNLIEIDDVLCFPCKMETWHHTAFYEICFWRHRIKALRGKGNLIAVM